MYVLFCTKCISFAITWPSVGTFLCLEDFKWVGKCSRKNIRKIFTYSTEVIRFRSSTIVTEMTQMTWSFPVLTMSLGCAKGSEYVQSENGLDRKLTAPRAGLVAKRQLLPLSKIKFRPYPFTVLILVP